MRVGDVDLKVRHGGDGFPLVMVHGFTGSKEDWSYVAPELCRHFRVATYDQRGHGESSKPEGRAAYSIDILADDLAGLIDALGVDRTHLCGHSLGGVVVQFYLARHGTDRVGKVVLVDTTHQGRRPHRIEQQLDDAARFGMCEMTAREFAANAPNPLMELMPDVVGFMRRRQEEMSLDAFLSIGHELLDLPDTLPRLRGVDVPTLVLCGERDESTPPEVNQALAAGMPRGRYVEIPHSGHTPQFENIPAWLAAVVPFLTNGGPPMETAP